MRLRLTIETRPWLPLRALAVDFLSGGVCSAEGDDRVWRRGKLDVLTRSGRLWDSIPADTRRRRARVFLRQVQHDADTMALVAFLAEYGLRPWDAPSEWGLRNL